MVGRLIYKAPISMIKYFLFSISVILFGCSVGDKYNYIEKYASGQTKVEANYIADSKNGKYQEYYENGSIKYQSYFINGLQSDTTKYFSKDGSIQYIQIWDNGIPKQLFQKVQYDIQKSIAGTDDFYDKNLIIHNNLKELSPTLKLLDDSIRLDSMNVRIVIPNCIRPHKIELSKGKIKSVDHFGHILITDFDINKTTIYVSIMSIDGMLKLPAISLSKIEKTFNPTNN